MKLPDEFITECRRKFDDDPSTRTLIELLHEAAKVGRESAYTEDEWRVAYRVTGLSTSSSAWTGSEAQALRWLQRARKSGKAAWIEHRRTGATDWRRVDADS